MKIVIDSDIPFVAGVFEPYADVEYVGGRSIDRSAVADADALIVRTRTQCDKALMGGSSVRVVATATIGTDHIDMEWCSAAGIAVHWAAGCNARAVAQWVFAALTAMDVDSGTIGIVGVGNVGSEVRDMGIRRGFDILCCDPPLRAMGEGGFCDLDELLHAADVVTLHVPLLPTTRGMVDARFLGKMGAGTLLLNSSRGEIVCEAALLQSTYRIRYAIDVWQGEPNINLNLMEHAAIATPHIAGYSARGKARGTQMAVRAVAAELGIAELCNWSVEDAGAGTGIGVGHFQLEEPDSFDIMAVDRALRHDPSQFESLRTVR